MTLKNALKSSLSLSDSRSEREAYKLNQIQISRPKTISNFTHRGRKSDDLPTRRINLNKLRSL